MEDASMTRFRCARTTAALGAVLCVVVLLLPVLVSAESQTVVTEYANFQPYADNNDEVVNIANETIRTNIDTWNPRPSGVFVGGTIEESLLRLNEVGTSSRNWLMVTTVVQFDEAYTMNGASQCIVRLPMYVDDEPSNQTQADLWIYRLATVAAPSFGFNSTTAEPVVTSATNLVARYENIARIYAHDSDAPIWRDMSRESWLSEHRLYVRLIAPLLSGVPYLLVARMFVPAGVPFDVYFHPSDLCSDSILMTRIVYSWMQAPDRLYYQVRPVEADAGWSFVFQQGLGGMGMVYDHYFYATQMIVFDKWVRV
ncbi:hypothetical protein, partial [Methanothrix sp.]|uniref:hypothetical protein n=1 Tax=Methanothrix sp. TaxID=90426 RepID=UPI0034E1CD87